MQGISCNWFHQVTFFELLTLTNAFLRYIMSQSWLLLKYGAVVWSPYAKSDMRQVDKVQNRVLGFAGYCLNIAHPQYNYRSIKETLRLRPLSERRIRSWRNFTRRLIKGHIDAPYLLERHCIRVPGNTKLQGSFYLPVSRINLQMMLR